jgi:hypothetical protein
MKPPKNIPTIGERCRLRGRSPTGIVRTINAETNWTRVDWDEGCTAPLICHLHELERVMVFTSSSDEV